MNVFNSLKVGQKIIVGYIAILTLMVIITVVLLYNQYGVTHEFNFLIEHDQPILSNAYLLEKLVVDMETGERGFLITGKDEFLEPYQNGNTEFKALLEIEKQLVSDNPSQIAMLEEIGRLHEKWIKVAAQPEIATWREANKATVNADYLQELLKKGVGKGILDKLRGVLEQLEVNLTNKGKLENVILTVKIAKDMVDQETGQRGFIITGEDSFLEPYHHGQTQLATDIAALRQQLTADSDNLALLSQVETLATEWLEKAAKPEIGARQTMNANPVTVNDVAALIQAGTGKNILDAMRAQFADFVQTEIELNTQRTENVKQNVIIVRNLTIGLALGAIIIGMLLGIFVSRSITHPLLKLTDMANKMALGDMGQVLNQQNRLYMSRIMVRRDEMGNIGQAYDSLANYFGALIADIVQVSQELAGGNLRVTPKIEYKGDFVQIKNALEISLTNLQQVVADIVQVSQRLAEGGQNAIAKAEYRGDFVQVKNALETAAGKLAEATTNNATQDWLKTGQARLNEQIAGEQKIVTMSKKIISFLTTYIESQIGLFYMLAEEDGQPYLQIIAHYAYVPGDKIAKKILLTEGLAGQAALEQKIILRNQTPEECPALVSSGLARSLPRHVILLPFLYENEVKGVIEIGSTTIMTDIQQSFLEQVMPNIGIAVNTAQSRTQMQTLLEQSQRQSEELRSKQTELQHTNEELTSQSEELQSQSEELQTQQEELRQTNEDLEGRTRDLERQKLAVQEKNQALSQTHTEMEQAKLAIEAKAKELALASKYKSEFLANMSHELRTPLNSLLILAKLLADNKSNTLTVKQVEYAATIHSAGNDLLTLINDILDLSKIEAGKIEIQWEDVLLGDLLTMVEQKFRHVAEDKGLAFHLMLAEDVPSVLYTDGQRLKQIINNLLSNSFKFTSTGEIKVMAQRPTSIPSFSALSRNVLEATKTVAISVSDTGIGIPEDKQQVIFEAFQQADGTTNRRYGGTGLGLSISRQLARLLGGELTLVRSKDKGTTFTLYLPIGESQSQSNSNQAPPR
jgi:signal transduction histidine kinase/CHASE3 domain sensor protein